MHIINRTDNKVFFNTNGPSAADCGTLEPGENRYLAYREGPFRVRLAPFTEDGKVGSGVFIFNEVGPGAIVAVETEVEFS